MQNKKTKKVKKQEINIEPPVKFLIMSDLDGTLLNSKEQLSDQTVKIIKKISDQGHLFAIATGRPKRASVDFYRRLGLKTLMVNFNGSYINNPSKPKFTPINLGFNYKIAINIFNNKRIHKWIENVIIENMDGVFVYQEPKNVKQRNALYSHFHIEKKDKFRYIAKDWTNIHSDIHSILILLKNEKYIDELTYEIKRLSNTLIVRTWSIPSAGTIIEINSIFSSKGMALKYLSSYYGIPLENCFAFGDGDNDNEMLRTAHYGYAMKNGSMTAKLSARFLTEFTNDKDGVALTLKKFFNIH